MAKEKGAATRPGEWTIPVADDSGSKDRATVALVDAKLTGLRDLVRVEFEFLRERSEPLMELPVIIARLRAEHALLANRVTDLEQKKVRRFEWRRSAFWATGLALLGVAVNVVIGLHLL